MRINLLALLFAPLLAFGQIAVTQPGETVSIGDGIRLQVPAFDADTLAYFNRAGVTDATAKQQISDFVKGVKALGLWSNMVCWPMRSAQNAGTGTTVYSLGGLGTYNGTMVNGPTWGADGMAFGSGTWITIPSAVGIYNAQTLGHLVAVAVDSNPTGGASTHTTFIFFNNASGSRALVATRLGGGNNFTGGGRRTDADSFAQSTSANSASLSYLESRMNWAGGNVTLVANGVAASAANFVSGAGATSATNSSGVYIGSDAGTGHFVGSVSFAMAIQALPSLSEAESLRALYKSTLGAGLSLP